MGGGDIDSAVIHYKELVQLDSQNIKNYRECNFRDLDQCPCRGVCFTVVLSQRFHMCA